MLKVLAGDAACENDAKKDRHTNVKKHTVYFMRISSIVEAMQTVYRFPQKLKRGDVVRVVAPCGVLKQDALEEGLLLLRAQGLVPRYHPRIFESYRYLAGDDHARGADLNDALNDRESKAIWVARGGYGSARLLPHLTSEMITRSSPWLIGFSDVTALHTAWSRAGVASLHAANLVILPSWSCAARDELFAWLFDADETVEEMSYSGTIVSAPSQDVVQGFMWAGNTAVLSALAGTEFWPSREGAIVLLEEVNDPPYKIDRMLTQLIQAGFFKGVRGVVLGQLTDCETPTPQGYSARDVAVEILSTLGVPVLADVQVGHGTLSRMIPIGAQAVLDVAAQNLRCRKRGV